MRIKRIIILMGLFLFIYLAMAGNLAYYQLVRGRDIARQAVAMRSEQIALKEFSRGDILDRNLLPLSGGRTSVAVYCLPREALKAAKPSKNNKLTNEKVLQDVALALAQAINGLDPQAVEKQLTQALKRGYPLVRIASDLDGLSIANLESQKLPGVVVAPIIKRYQEDGMCAHIIGYVSGIDPVAGQAGIERTYNNILSNNPSSPGLVTVLDARGEAIKGLMFKIRREQEEHHASVVLTIDKQIQQMVEQAMKDKVYKGAVVVMDVDSKEILAMASRPVFNPYDISKALQGEDAVLTNRALSRYHPGSLFKIVVAAAAIEEKKVLLQEKFNCEGSFKFSEQVSISCWKEYGHGTVDFVQGFASSCNPTLIEVGLRVGKNDLLRYVERLHLEDENIIGMGKYRAGSYVSINPGPAALGNASLGQQGVMLTPLQMTSLVATIADDGQWNHPSIVRYTQDYQGQKNRPVTRRKEQVLSISTAKALQGLMEQVVEQGTGKNAAINEVKIAGKTATSQTGRYTEQNDEVLNTWFAGYFPADNPRWAVVVMVEEGISGSQSAAPVFKEIAGGILNYYSVNDVR
ncbi:peptidoglycan D,D-transpeptidase FtsI family protein [Syntrophomonas erecta]